MAIGIVTDEDFQRELDKHTPSSKRVPSIPSPVVDVVHTPEIVSIPTRGRSDGDVNVPDSLRKLIGEEALLNGRPAAIALAASFGISASSVSAYTKGATSTSSYNQPKPSIVGHINKSRTRAIGRAQKTLNGSLAAITQDKLDYSDARDLSAIAKDMSVVIKNLEPPQVPHDPTAQVQPQFTIYAPQFRDERSFEIITVNE